MDTGGRGEPATAAGGGFVPGVGEMRRWHYRLMLAALTPWLVVDALRRHRRAPAGHRRRFEQFGRLRDGLPDGGVWLHAVSLGEVRAAASLVRVLRERWPTVPVVVSTTTETGAGAARALGVPHFYAPYDLALVQRRVLRRLRPRLVLIMETELWPNLVRESRRAGVPLVIANARLSDRSWRRYRRWGGKLLGEVLADIDLICAQSATDRDRFERLGAPRAEDCGNLKFDLALPGVPDDLPADRARTWLAASTHPGEEEQVLDAHRLARERSPGARLILVPRHPERADEVIRLVEKRGLSVVRWRPDGSADAEVEVVDRAGVLAGLFAEVPVVFMGGSLVSTGGHNPIEPAVVGRAVMHGPHVSNFRAVFSALEARRASLGVADARELGERVAWAFARPTEWAGYGQRAREVIAEHRGATERVVKRIAQWLDRG
ncbi:MAG: 3-deoxy-D-manno-octulosonic acid transferase [Guyparkeria sp.]|uniref:3-deoxy-D-manno-octulosonic acid transferase n=1 Tax=Guyparkeria sp. TaxID=2035736 RepID=UPI003979297C